MNRVEGCFWVEVEKWKQISYGPYEHIVALKQEQNKCLYITIRKLGFTPPPAEEL
mgnify:CR=1 FL=1